MKGSKTLLRNEDTIRRRAWVDSALKSVRDKLLGSDNSELAISKTRKPVLYVASPERRSGTGNRRSDCADRRRSGT